jgi:hypothetical protein
MADRRKFYMAEIKVADNWIPIASQLTGADAPYDLRPKECATLDEATKICKKSLIDRPDQDHRVTEFTIEKEYHMVI